MPRLSCWFIRASFAYLLIGFTLGALLLTAKALPQYGPLWRLLPVHIEFVFMGWTVQLIMGVAYFMLPRFAGGERRRERAAWLAFLLLNVGTILAGLSPVVGLAPMGTFLGRLADMGAAAAFAFHAWPRVKPFMT